MTYILVDCYALVLVCEMAVQRCDTDDCRHCTLVFECLLSHSKVVSGDCEPVNNSSTDGLGLDTLFCSAV